MQYVIIRLYMSILYFIILIYEYIYDMLIHAVLLQSYDLTR